MKYFFIGVFIASVFLLPWYLSLGIAIFLMFRYKFFLLPVMVFFAMDVIFYEKDSSYLGGFDLTVFSVLLAVFIFYLQKVLWSDVLE